MSGLKRLSSCVFLSGLLASPVAADVTLPELFATCAGRLSAQLQHEWLMLDGHAATTERQLNAVTDVLDALSSDQNAKLTMSLRINAKMAHAALLTRATFNTDPEDAHWAAGTADRYARQCARLVLDGPDIALSGTAKRPPFPTVLADTAQPARILTE